MGLGLLRAFFGPDDERPWMEPLRAAIRTQLEVPPSHRLETMTYSFDESGAVPGLRYIVAWYPGIEAPDRVFSVLAYRDPRSEGLLRRFVRPEYHVLSRLGDWGAAAAWLAELDRALHPPAVRAFEDGWTADAWLVEHGRKTRYTCELTTGEGGLEASLAVTDSIRWTGVRAETG